MIKGIVFAWEGKRTNMQFLKMTRPGKLPEHCGYLMGSPAGRWQGKIKNENGKSERVGPYDTALIGRREMEAKARECWK